MSDDEYVCECDTCGAEYPTDSARVADGWRRRHPDEHDSRVIGL